MFGFREESNGSYDVKSEADSQYAAKRWKEVMHQHPKGCPVDLSKMKYFSLKIESC